MPEKEAASREALNKDRIERVLMALNPWTTHAVPKVALFGYVSQKFPSAAYAYLCKVPVTCNPRDPSVPGTLSPAPHHSPSKYDWTHSPRWRHWGSERQSGLFTVTELEQSWNVNPHGTRAPRLSLHPGLPVQRGRVVPGPGEGGVFHGDAVCTPAWKAPDTTRQA